MPLHHVFAERGMAVPMVGFASRSQRRDPEVVHVAVHPNGNMGAVQFFHWPPAMQALSLHKKELQGPRQGQRFAGGAREDVSGSTLKTPQMHPCRDICILTRLSERSGTIPAVRKRFFLEAP